MLVKLAYILFHVHFIPHSPLHRIVMIGRLHSAQYSRTANILLGILKKLLSKTSQLASTAPLPSNSIARKSFSRILSTRTLPLNTAYLILVETSIPSPCRSRLSPSSALRLSTLST
ncbi:hypothetical protein TcCL_Unassigned00104 [Trypanosoma cruzi]|nr:hypothetical protein TcCL_Unassigned00104 [Trypanosoma cruzi]